MYKKKLFVAGVITGLLGTAAWACGPMFPSSSIEYRVATLTAAPKNSFDFEAKHLLVATDSLKAAQPVESVDTYGERLDERVVKAKRLGLTVNQTERVDALRQADSDQTAYDNGGDLPEDLRLYTAGAVAYDAAGKDCEAGGSDDGSVVIWDECLGWDLEVLNHAIVRFDAVLALPPGEAKLRSVWAAYMLGRIHAIRARQQSSDRATFKRERDAAAKAFELSRVRAVAGAADSQGLAVDSFGEQARMYLYNGDQHCSYGDLYSNNDCSKGVASADMKHAIALYAAQAGHDHDGAVQSLAVIADSVLQSGERTAAIVDGPVSRQLLVAYASHSWAGSDMDIRLGAATDTADAWIPDRVKSRLAALVDAIEKQGIEQVSGADRLASLAYEMGRYDLAAKLADKAAGPLASWVRAKLALQKGDLAAANAAYAEAIRALPTADDPQSSVERGNAGLVMNEQGVLALARGEYIEAMGHLYEAVISVGVDKDDMSYVAERVLTVDELKAFVGARAPATPAPEKIEGKSYYNYESSVADNLRWLLARRLMRGGRYDEAIPYFPVSGDPRFADVDLRAKAGEYAKAMHDSEHAWTDIARAEARFKAAVIARVNGLEVLGYERDPDFNIYEGGFPYGSSYWMGTQGTRYVTEGERKRFVESTAKPNLRFHYRYVAVDHASAAADLLPPRSQAFAAVLCKATGWMFDGPSGYGFRDWGNNNQLGQPAPDERGKRIHALYGRYVEQGPYVAWAEDFGRHCEEPNFASARALQWSQRVKMFKQAVRRHLPYEAVGLLIVLGVSVALIKRRRRRRGAA